MPLTSSFLLVNDKVPCGLFKFLQSFPFNLPDSLSGHVKVTAHFFQSPGLSIFKAEAEFQHLSFPFRQALKKFFNLLPKENGAGRIIGSNSFVIFNEVPQMGIFFFANRRFQGNRILSDFLTSLIFPTVTPIALASSSLVASLPFPGGAGGRSGSAC